MGDTDRTRAAVDTLVDLGLRESTAQCFVGLCRHPNPTARVLSELTGIARSRVYESVRELESRGLVEVHHTTPRHFRAVDLDDAEAILRREHDRHVSRAREALEDVEPAATDTRGTVDGAWTVTGGDCVRATLRRVVEQCDDEFLVAFGPGATLSEKVASALRARGSVDLAVAGLTAEREAQVREAFPDARVIDGPGHWLPDASDSVSSVGTVALADRRRALVTAVDVASDTESGVVAEGASNGVVTLALSLLVGVLVPA